jgi:hypothetical protein
MTLTQITHIVNLLAMSISLWMAFYLFGRGYPNRTALLTSLALLAMGVFFLDTYDQFFSPYEIHANLRAALLVIAFACWHEAIHTLIALRERSPLRWLRAAAPPLAAFTTLLLIINPDASSGREDMLFTSNLGWNTTDVVYGATQLMIAAGILLAGLTNRRARATRQGKYLFAASLFLLLALGYGITALVVPTPMPRVIEDGLVFGGIFLLALSVARHQSLVERRVVQQDFWVTFLGMFLITALYLAIALTAHFPARLLGNLAALIICTHALYDLGREAVERWNLREEKRLRKRITQSTSFEDDALRIQLDRELALLLQALNAASGLIAANENGQWVALASHHSLPPGAFLPEDIPAQETVIRADLPAANLIWLSQTFEGNQPLALVGIGQSQVKIEYSSGELELLEEFSEQIGILISMSRLHRRAMQSAAERVAERLSEDVDADILKQVEDALRHYADVVYLAQSPLAEKLNLPERPHTERGRLLQRHLQEAVKSLRPEGERPPEPIPREWYHYVILHDAYLKGVPNREVMARLYVSEGTFHRARRQAIRGAARWLAEKHGGTAHNIRN